MIRIPVIRWRLAGLLPVLTLAFAAAGVAIPASAANDISRCVAIEDSGARLRCYESLTPPNPKLPPSRALASPGAPQTIGRWRLIRTPNPHGGKEAISIMRPGELSGSDSNFVGLMVRCAESDIEVLLVLIDPLPLRAHPRVSINGTKFESSVAPPGSAVLLPGDVAVLARQRWSTLPSLSFEIDQAGSVTKGHVFLKDFDAALKALTAACSLRQ